MRTCLVLTILLAVTAAAAAETPAPAPAAPGPAALPYIYTRWKQFTEKEGLPNDHIFAVKADGPRVWIGTENGLALLDKAGGRVVRVWKEADGLPFKAVTAIDVDRRTGDVWLGLFGGGLARLSGGRFDHYHQLNSGLVNDVVYGVAVENDNVWAATTAGACRLNVKTGAWTVFNEKNAPMEEIWNYHVAFNEGKVHLAVWGSGVLEYNVGTGAWKEYLDPDGEMEIDLFRDDGINHVIVTGAQYVEGVLWVSSYFGGSRYDGRHWRGYAQKEGGLPSDFGNNIRARSAREAWYCTDKGLGAVVDAPGDTWVVYTRDPGSATGRATVTQEGRIVEVVDTGLNVSQNFIINMDLDGNDLWIATAKGVAWGIGDGYYPGLKERPVQAYGPAPADAPRPAAPADAPGRAAGADAPPSRPAGTAAGYVPGAGTDWIPLDDPKVLEVLRKINAVGPYEVPPLGVKKDDNYAGTAVDVEPFRGQRPFKENFLEQMEYAGPGRANPEPGRVDSVKIGFIGPILSTVSVATGGKSHEEVLGIPMLQGARLAVEEWNARGGYLKRKIPFEIVVSNDNGLWGSSGNEIIKMAYRDDVFGILGTIDGANSHIAIRVALKAEVVMMNTGDTDPTFIETNIPWTLRNISDDRQMAYLLIDHLYRKLDLKKVGIIRASNRYGRFGVREVRDGSRRLGRPVPIEMAYAVGTDDFTLQLERMRDAKVEAVVHWGDARECGLILNQMRAMGMRQPYFGCDRCASDEFLKIAGPNAEGATFVFPWNPDRRDPKLDRFRLTYRERFGMEPETYAAHAYDGMNMLIWAVQVAGLNRAKIRDILAYLPRPWPGVTGDIVLSACLDDVGDVYLVTWKKGAWSYSSRKDLGIPKGYIPPKDRLNRDFAAANQAPR